MVHVDDPMASGPPGEAEKLFEALGMHIATRPGQPLHYSEASVYLCTRLWSTKSGFVEMPKEGCIEGIQTIAEQAGLHVRGGRGAATPGIKDKPKTKDVIFLSPLARWEWRISKSGSIVLPIIDAEVWTSPKLFAISTSPIHSIAPL